ncbi:10662_t:CDS:1, partial [Rhizophagus irregularis]
MPSQTNIDFNQTIFSNLTNLELDGSSSEKHQNYDTIQNDQYKNNIDELLIDFYMIWTRYK